MEGARVRERRARAAAAIAAVAASAALAVSAGAQGARQAPAGQQPAAPTAQGGSQGQLGDQAQKPPVFRAGVNVVRVDVIVSGKDGEPVKDLTAADFEISEDGKPQAIDLFKLVNSDGNVAPGGAPARPIRSLADQEGEAARDDVRLFVIFLDDYHVRKGAAMRVRETLAEFVRTQLGPLDMVAVMYPLMSVSELAFTRDPGALAASMLAFEGRKFDYRPRNAIEERYAHYPAQAVETIRNDVVMTALRGLAVKLGTLREGRKAVIFVSEGFTALLPPQMRDMNAQLPGLGNPNARNPFAGGSAAEERARSSADVQLLADLRQVFDAANRNNTAIYTLDPRGLAVSEFDINESVGLQTDAEYLRKSQDTLRILASNTDGRAIVNRNDLEGGLRQVVRDSSAYYLIGYTSPLAAPDGKFHEIKVRLRRPGLQVRARKGYWAPTEAEAENASAPPKPPAAPGVAKALSAVENRQRDAYVSTWVGTSRDADGGTRVTVVWEPVPPVPGEKREEAATVALLASSRGGDEYYRGPVPAETGADAAAAAPPPAAAPARRAASKVSFVAPPGRIQLRLTVQNGRGQVLDTLVQDQAVPDYAGTDVRLTTPVVLCARTAREFQAISRDADPVPTALREFRRTDRLLVRFFAHSATAGPPDVGARLLNRGGQKMLDLPLAASPDPAQPHQVDLPLASFSPGEYVIEIRARDVSGEATEFVGFRLIG
ncbi:MAG TPA: VWA domain-containing protein [Vicinamibacterales bacterium]|nr:VWA domain-containing protein [Vicinamibacterales bacterium]